MFDTIAGLPIHPLAVHAVVVLLPVMALLTIAVAARASWRRHARWVLVGNLGVLVAAVGARQSGLKLYSRVSQFGTPSDLVETHASYGKVMPLFALLLVVAAVVLLAAVNRPKIVPVAVVVAVVAGLAGIGATVVTGDSGARAVWSDTIKNTKG